jgi:hypothetical protein
VLVDPVSGEQVEVLDEATLLSEANPYDFASYKRMTMSVSTEHRQAIMASESSGKALASAEAQYHKALAIAVGRLKAQHGSTIAETLAKGEETVTAAKEARDSAAAVDRAAMERVRLCRDDRAAALTMGAWSRESGAEGWDR